MISMLIKFTLFIFCLFIWHFEKCQSTGTQQLQARLTYTVSLTRCWSGVRHAETTGTDHIAPASSGSWPWSKKHMYTFILVISEAGSNGCLWWWKCSQWVLRLSAHITFASEKHKAEKGWKTPRIFVFTESLVITGKETDNLHPPLSLLCDSQKFTDQFGVRRKFQLQTTLL